MRREWLIRLLIVAATLVASLVPVTSRSAQFTSFTDRVRPVILEGNWQSCRESDGVYSERIYDGKTAGLGPFELHMGPYHEFALFKGVQDDHREHSSADNLLTPYDVSVVS